MKTFVVPTQYIGAAWEDRIKVQVKVHRPSWWGRSVVEYAVFSNGTLMLEGIDLESGCGQQMSKADAFRTLCGFLGAFGESLSRSGDRSEYAREYTPEQREFLAANYERFSMCDIEAEEWSE